MDRARHGRALSESLSDALTGVRQPEVCVRRVPYTYWAFAFADSTRRAAWMSVTMVVVAAGLGYFRFVRYDAAGGGVLAMAVVVALGLVLVGRRRLQTS